MKKSRWYEYLTIITFIAMAAVCIYLNLFAGQFSGIANIIVNIAMFIIVGIILAVSETRCFIPASSMTRDLEEVTAKIKRDAMHSHRFLWEKYRDEKEELFTDKTLKDQYQDYLYELERVTHMDKSSFKCDIEDYINYDLVDFVIHRDTMNQVAGVMTGLGILGTFVGLSLGLQGFNTGSTAEITNSIEPLMRGIKVAFHTSIYGMVFSLTFNFAYKKRVDDAENAVRNFISAYKKYVMPDTHTDGVNRLLKLQQQQADAVSEITGTVAHDISEELSRLLNPELDRFDRTLSEFAKVATRAQKEAISEIVDSFIREMNKSLGQTFGQLSETISRTLLMQQENEKIMREIFERTGGTSDNMKEISRQTATVLAALDRYSASFKEMQGKMAETAEGLKAQSDMSRLLFTKEKEYLNGVKDYQESVQKAQDMLAAEIRENARIIKDLQRGLDEMPKKVDGTFQVINENLQDVENHFQDTIMQIKDATVGIQETVSDSYDRIEGGFDRASESVDNLARTLERYYRR